MENGNHRTSSSVDNHYVMMTSNDSILLEYSKLTSAMSSGPTPEKFKPMPLKEDYTRGYIHRCCIVKRNDQLNGYEINPLLSSNVDIRLYYVISFPWRIAGKKNRTVVNGIVEDFGVSETNTATLNKQDVPLTRFFSNPLEFWRGS